MAKDEYTVKVRVETEAEYAMQVMVQRRDESPGDGAAPQQGTAGSEGPRGRRDG